MFHMGGILFSRQHYIADTQFCQAESTVQFTVFYHFYRILWVACFCVMLYNGNRSVHFHITAQRGHNTAYPHAAFVPEQAYLQTINQIERNYDMKANKHPDLRHIRRRIAASVTAILALLLPVLPLQASNIGTDSGAAVQIRAAHYQTVPVYIDGVRAKTDAYIIENGVTYLPLRTLAEQFLENPRVYWDSKNGCAAVKTASLSLTAKPGDCYIIANGRYLALSSLYPAENTLVGGVTYVPLRTAVKAMGGEIHWNGQMRAVEITSGSGTITSGSQYYREDDVYWLSRIIYAESGAEPLRGQLAVGSVVMNRVAAKQFPNTIYGVIFDRKWGVQFTPIANGAIYKTPSAESIIAAKLTLDGCRISEDALYFLDPRLASSFWIVENRQALFSIGCHDFYS